MADENNGALQPTVRVPLTLDDFAPVEVKAVIKTKYGRVIEVSFVPLTWAEWDECGREVPDPKIPKTKLAEDGQTLLPNPDDTRYLEQLNAAIEERIARRFFRSLEKAGNTFEGNTPLEKLAAFRRKGDNLLVSKLMNAVLATGWEGSAEVQRRADSFPQQQLRQSGDADHGEDGLDAGAVEIAVGG